MKRLFSLVLASVLTLNSFYTQAQEPLNGTVPKHSNGTTPSDGPKDEALKLGVTALMMFAAVTVGAVVLYFQQRKNSETKDAFWNHNAMQTFSS